LGIAKILSSYIREYENTFMPAQFERPSWDEYFMLQAELAKLRSNCMPRKVGAVIVREHSQIATGYNGTPPGIKNCFEW
jgi:dCMP deaminase